MHTVKHHSSLNDSIAISLWYDSRPTDSTNVMAEPMQARPTTSDYCGNLTDIVTDIVTDISDSDSRHTKTVEPAMDCETLQAIQSKPSELVNLPYNCIACTDFGKSNQPTKVEGSRVLQQEKRLKSYCRKIQPRITVCSSCHKIFCRICCSAKQQLFYGEFTH